jgi:hypothetical protein
LLNVCCYCSSNLIIFIINFCTEDLQWFFFILLLLEVDQAFSYWLLFNATLINTCIHLAKQSLAPKKCPPQFKDNIVNMWKVNPTWKIWRDLEQIIIFLWLITRIVRSWSSNYRECMYNCTGPKWLSILKLKLDDFKRLIKICLNLTT